MRKYMDKGGRGVPRPHTGQSSKQDSRLFEIRQPPAVKVLSQKVLCVHGTMHVLSTADWRWWQPLSVIGNHCQWWGWCHQLSMLVPNQTMTGELGMWLCTPLVAMLLWVRLRLQRFPKSAALPAAKPTVSKHWTQCCSTSLPTVYSAPRNTVQCKCWFISKKLQSLNADVSPNLTTKASLHLQNILVIVLNTQHKTSLMCSHITQHPNQLS